MADLDSTIIYGYLQVNDILLIERDATIEGQLTINEATGTAPLIVTSTTKVDNLNVDLLDGYHASSFSLTTHNHDSQYLGISAKAVDSDKLDGLDSTAFAAASHNHDTEYLGISAKAADADLLDGLDSTAFVKTSDYENADVLAKVKAVDGSGSGLDADLLDGQDGTYYLNWTNFTNKPTTFTPSSHGNEAHTETYITSTGVTFENLNLNGDVGTGATQVAFGNHTHTLNDISDVTATPAITGEVLIYDASATTWVNKTLSEAGIASSTHNHDSTYLKLTGGTISGTLQITGTTAADGKLYAGITAPTNTTRLNYDGYFYATKVFNAVFNDYAECFETEVNFNDCKNRIVEIKNDKVYISSPESKSVIGVVSDSYGFILYGSEEEIQNGEKVPIGMAGTLMVDSEDIVDEEHMNKFICSGENGKARVIPEGEAYKYEGKIVGKIIGTNYDKNQYKIIICLK